MNKSFMTKELEKPVRVLFLTSDNMYTACMYIHITLP